MKITDTAKLASKFVVDNSPAIMTAAGVTGALTTAYLSVKATFKAADTIQDDYNQRIAAAGGINGDWEPMTAKEKLKLVWKEYIPAGISMVLTASAIVAANRAGSRRTAGLAAAYSVVQKSFDDYREIVVEKLGDIKEREVHDQASQKNLVDNPPTRPVIITGRGKHLCFDSMSGQYFESSMEEIRKAENETYSQILHDDYASVADFYYRLGINQTDFSDQLGWRSGTKFELSIDTRLSVDDIPTITIDFRSKPIPDYYKGH